MICFQLHSVRPCVPRQLVWDPFDICNCVLGHRIDHVFGLEGELCGVGIRDDRFALFLTSPNVTGESWRSGDMTLRHLDLVLSSIEEDTKNVAVIPLHDARDTSQGGFNDISLPIFRIRIKVVSCDLSRYFFRKSMRLSIYPSPYPTIS